MQRLPIWRAALRQALHTRVEVGLKEASHREALLEARHPTHAKVGLEDPGCTESSSSRDKAHHARGTNLASAVHHPMHGGLVQAIGPSGSE